MEHEPPRNARGRILWLPVGFQVVARRRQETAKPRDHWAEPTIAGFWLVEGWSRN
jgi:hypothetical protein